MMGAESRAVRLLARPRLVASLCGPTARLGSPLARSGATASRPFATAAWQQQKWRHKTDGGGMRPRKAAAAAAAAATGGRRGEVGSFLVPGTLVAPPIWRFPRQPGRFWRLLMHVARWRVRALVGFLTQYVASRAPDGSRLWPRFRLRRRRAATVAEAKALHLRYYEAVADGDLDALRALCTPELYASMAGVLRARPAAVRTEWRLVGYTDRFWYPRLADDLVMEIPTSDGRGITGRKLMRQSVVSISSEQRLARYAKGTGKLMDGSGKTKKLLEHIVLQTTINEDTWQQKPWRIWGMVAESTLESYERELEGYKSLEEEQRKHGGFL